MATDVGDFADMAAARLSISMLMIIVVQYLPYGRRPHLGANREEAASPSQLLAVFAVGSFFPLLSSLPVVSCIHIKLNCILQNK